MKQEKFAVKTHFEQGSLGSQLELSLFLLAKLCVENGVGAKTALQFIHNTTAEYLDIILNNKTEA